MEPARLGAGAARRRHPGGREEPAQLARLRADGCDLAQGHLLHRPLIAAAAGALLRTPVATG